MGRLSVYHFSVANEGGVHTVIKNIIQFSQNLDIRYHLIYLNKGYNSKSVAALQTIDNICIKFSNLDNLYHVFKKIQKQLNFQNSILACHDWTELAMVSHLGLTHPVVFFLHGDYEYYYDTALKNEKAISVFIAPTLNIYNTLLKLMPYRKSEIQHIPYPVQLHSLRSLCFDKINCAFYVANLSDGNKNFKALPLIDKLLVEQGVYVNWNVAGGGITDLEFINSWEKFDPNRIKYYGYLEPKALSEFLQSSNIFILPSKAEGMPISLIESMKIGLVPIVNQWNNSVFEYINDGQNGFVIQNCNLHEFSSIIKKLYDNKELLKILSDNAKAQTHSKNDIQLSVTNIEKIFESLSNQTIVRKKVKIYGSRLDHPLIPNYITKVVRKMLTNCAW